MPRRRLSWWLARPGVWARRRRPPVVEEIQAPDERLAAAKKGARCPKASGRLAGKSLGELKLGMTRSRARNVLTHWSPGATATWTSSA